MEACRGPSNPPIPRKAFAMVNAALMRQWRDRRRDLARAARLRPVWPCRPKATCDRAWDDIGCANRPPGERRGGAGKDGAERREPSDEGCAAHDRRGPSRRPVSHALLARAATYFSLGQTGTMSGRFLGNFLMTSGSMFNVSATMSIGLCASQSDSDTSWKRSARKISM